MLNEGELFTMTYAPAAGYEFVDDQELGVRTAEETTTIIPPAVQIADPAATINGVRYATLGEAFTAAEDGDTVVIQKDIVLADAEASALPIESKTITVDLNGKTYSYWTGYCWRLKSATVTINDTSVGQTGAIIKRDDATMIEIDANSKVIFNAGLIAMGTASKTGSTGGCFKVLGELEVNGGTITSYVGGYARSYSFSIRGNGKVTVKNGAKVVTPVQFTEGGQEANLVVAEDSTSLFGNDWSAYCSAGQIMDDSQDGTATPYFVGDPIAITYVYGEGTAPATANKAAFAAYTANRTFTLNQPTGAEFDKWTASNAAITFDGDVMTIPADFNEAFTVTANYKAAEEPDPTKDDPKDIPADKTAAEYFPNVSAEIAATGILAKDLATWCQKDGVKGTVADGGVDIKLDAYKLDCANTIEAINAAKANFKFTAADLAQAMAGETLTTLNEQSINGTLVVTKWADPAFTVQYTDGNACFYKAEVKVPGEK